MAGVRGTTVQATLHQARQPGLTPMYPRMAPADAQSWAGGKSQAVSDLFAFRPHPYQDEHPFICSVLLMADINVWFSELKGTSSMLSNWQPALPKTEIARGVLKQ